MNNTSVVEQLEKIRDDLFYRKVYEEESEHLGLCHYLRDCISRVEFIDMIECWEGYSGCRVYPICTSDVDSPADQYYNTLRMYDLRTNYGKARLDLMNHIIKCYAEKEKL